MGKFFLGLLSFLFVSQAAFAINYKTGNCESSEFNKYAWDDIIRQEPRIHDELGYIGNASGNTGSEVPLTNCRVEWPVDERGNAIAGYRTAILHKVWYDQTKQPAVRREGGIRIVWYTSMDESQVGSSTYITIRRTVKGFTICRGEEVCGVLNVLGLKKEDPTPVSIRLK